MGVRSTSFSRILVAAAALLGVQACQGSEREATTDAAARDPAGAPAGKNESLRTAAEPFEALTEQAFTADWPTVDRLVSDASSAVAGLSSASAVEGRLADIAASRAARDRVGLALNAVEGYRALVEAQDPATADPPVAVSLLDYAGFRYDALAQAPTVDWPEMARSVEFARRQWNAASGKVSSKAMPGVVNEALSAMAAAVARKDVSFARSAAATELALVDLLEEQTKRVP